MGLLNEESKEHELIMERNGKYLPVVDTPKSSLKLRVSSYSELCYLPFVTLQLLTV